MRSEGESERKRGHGGFYRVEVVCWRREDVVEGSLYWSIGWGQGGNHMLGPIVTHNLLRNRKGEERAEDWKWRIYLSIMPTISEGSLNNHPLDLPLP
jgi:hypothetical protein